MEMTATLNNQIPSIDVPNPKDFLSKLTHSKEKTKESLREKLHSAKLVTIKDELRKRNIEFDDSINDLNKLKTSLKKNLSSIGYQQVEDIYESVNNKFDKLLNDLENGSLDAASKFLKSAEKITTPIAKTVAKSLASRTAIVLAPTIPAKVAIAGGLLANTTYKVAKNKKDGQVLTQESECDRILQEMEVTYADGKVVDTRFNEEIQEEIRKFLTNKKIDFNDTGYLSLREQIYSLNFENKVELCNLLNTKMNKGIEVNERIESKKGNFFDSVKNAFKKVRNTVLAGVGGAAAVNTVDPAIIGGVVNGTALGTLISHFTDSKIIQAITGLFGGVGSAILERIPIVGDAAKSVLAAESLAAGGIVGAGLGVAGLIVGDIVKTIKNIKDKFAYVKNRNEILKYDNEKYASDNKEEYTKMREVIYNKENDLGEMVIFQLIYEYMSKDLNIKFENEPKNITQLMETIEKLDSENKKKVRVFIDKLIDYNKNNHSDFVNAILKGGKTVSTIAMLGLSGMSIYDLIKGGTFLPNLSKKLFGNVPGNIYTQIQHKDTVDVIDTANVKPDNPNQIEMIPKDEVGKTASAYKELEGKTYEGNQIDVIKEEGQTFINDPLGYLKNKFTPDNTTNEVTPENTTTVHTGKSGRLHGGGGRSIDVPTTTDPPKIDIEFPDTAIEAPRGEFTPVETPPAPTKGNQIIETIKNLPKKIKGVGEAIGEDLGKVADGAKDIADGIVGNKTIVDKSAIEEYIRNMSDDELVNLAYYYNNSPDIDTSNITYKTIGEVMAQTDNFNRINKAIERYNQKMEMIRNVSDGIKTAGIVMPVVEEGDKELQKVA